LHAGVATHEIGSDDILDEEALMTLVGGDRQLAGELAELYLDDLEPRVSEIASAAQDGNADRLWSAAHSLRGSSGSIKAENVFAVAGALEAIGRSGKLEGVQDALKALDAALVSLRPRLVALAGRA
jgi:HPt (histidine-containing phosphotransfer) domain-containing protein